MHEICSDKEAFFKTMYNKIKKNNVITFKMENKS